MGWVGRALIGLFLVLALALLALNFFCPERKEPHFEIGAILPLSGGSAQYGKWMQEALDLAAKQINSEGGINGEPLHIIYEDDQAIPRLGASAMQKLAEVDKVPVVFGPWASSSVLAAAPIAERDRVIILAEAVSSKIRDAGDYIFRVQPDGALYMRALAEFAYRQLNFRRIAIIYVNNDFGVDLAAEFKEDFERLGGMITSENGFLQTNTDFRTELTIAKAKKPNAIFAPMYTEIGNALNQAKELGLNIPFLATATFENPAVLETARGAAEGVIYPYHFDPSSSEPKVQAYQQSYYDAYGRSSEGFAVLAYDGLKLLAGILRACKKDTECIKTRLYQTQDYAGVTGSTSFDDKGDIIKPIIIKTVRDGKFVRYSAGDSAGAAIQK